MLKRKGQGAFEYILLIGGVLVIVVLVIMVLRGTGSSSAAALKGEMDNTLCQAFDPVAISTSIDAPSISVNVRRLVIVLHGTGINSNSAVMGKTASGQSFTFGCVDDGTCTGSTDFTEPTTPGAITITVPDDAGLDQMRVIGCAAQ